jgi:hypothetical protein
MSVREKMRQAGETVDDLGDLIRKLDRVASLLTLEANRQSELITLLRGPLANNVIWDGTVALDATGRFTRSFQVPFASMLVADSNGVGPFSISTEPNDGALGVGTAPIPFGATAMVPFTGRQLYISGGKPNGTLYIALFSIQKEPFFDQLVSTYFTGDAIAASAVPIEGTALLGTGGLVDRWRDTSASPSSAALGVGTVATGLDRVLSLNAQSALNTLGAVLDGGVCRSSHIIVVTSSAGVASGAVQLQGSLDNVNWYNLGAAVNTNAASSTFAPVAVAGTPTRYLRATITTVITGGTISASISSSG